MMWHMAEIENCSKDHFKYIRPFPLSHRGSYKGHPDISETLLKTEYC